MSEPLLSVRELAVTFPGDEEATHAVDGVSFELGAGEVLALVGESGSGKSVTAAALVGLLATTDAHVEGSARYRGTELIGASEAELRPIRGAEIAIVVQDSLSSLNPVQRVGDQIAEQLRAHEQVGARAARERAVELLSRVEVPHPHAWARAYPHELSGGMRQRALIAMALSCRPSVLIADEPTTALDVTIQAQILALIRELRDETGAGVLLITHDFGVVAELADRVAVMDAGRVVESGPLGDVFAAPSAARTRALLDAVPRLDDPLRRPLARTGRDGPVLELEHVKVRFTAPRRRPFGAAREPTQAVDDVTLTVHAGETVGLVGESGSGKTTLARVAVRLIEPTRGAVRIAGEGQLVFQDPLGSLNPRKRIGDSIGLAVRLRGVSRREETQRVAELLDRVGLERGHAERWPHELSGGQRQRVGIARALALNPRLVVLDEPLSALDVTVQARIIDLLDGLQRDLGIAYLLVTHDLSVVRQVVDRVAVMYLGKLVELSPAELLYPLPVHPYTAGLLSAIPSPGGRPTRSGRRVALPRGEPPSDRGRPSGCVFHPRCPRATDVCRSVEPPLTVYADGRSAACHHPLNVAKLDLAGASRSEASPLSAGAALPAGPSDR